MSSPPKTSDAESRSSPQTLEERLQRLERRLDLELSPPSADGSATRMRELAAAVHDIAHQQQNLRRDLETLFEALESRSEEVEGVARETVPSSRPAALPAPGGSWIRRAARWLLRNTLGRARALWHATDPHRPPTLVLSAGQAVELPGSMRVRNKTGSAAGLDAEQTSPPAWQANESQAPGSYRLLEAPPDGQGMLRTTWELLAWVLATEPLAFLELRLAGGSRILLAADAPQGSEPAVGKLLSFPRGAPQRPLGPELTPAFRPSEADGYLVNRQGQPPRSHAVSPLLSPTSAREPSRRLLLLDTALRRDSAEWCARHMQTRGGPESWLLISRIASDEPQSRRLSSFETLGALCYPLADFLATEIMESALDVLTALYSVSAVTRLGEGPCPADDLARWRTLDFEDVDLRRPEDLQLSALEEDPAGPEPVSGTRLRAELGVEPEQILVVQTCDLERDQRPEDFLLLTHELREDRRFFFLLCGEGPAAGTLADLESYLALPRYRHLASQPRQELLAAADVVTSTAESLPLPFDLAAALAADRPVVAAAAAGLERLSGARQVPVGDLRALAQALRGIAATSDSSRPARERV